MMKTNKPNRSHHKLILHREAIAWLTPPRLHHVAAGNEVPTEEITRPESRMPPCPIVTDRPVMV